MTKKCIKGIVEGGIFFYGATKGSFVLPPHGYALWKNIQNILDKKFAVRGVQNVLLPTLIPLDLLEREKEHVAGFSPECFYVERIGEKKLETPLVLRPTSEVLFYEWYQQILRSYQQLPFLYNQWCSVFRAEKNTSPFFRNTEFLWQEGHTIHASGEEARQFTLDILADYRDYAENALNLAVIVGKKTEGEKFAGALETYTVECLLPDGQCLQFATSHYFGDNFCRLMEVDFQNKNNKMQHPFSTSWGTSTRAIGAIAETHNDKLGIILPFDVAPVQIAFILREENEELINYYQKTKNLLNTFRCQLYNKYKQAKSNIIQADKEGCPLKIILGKNELEQKIITLARRDDVKRKITISLENSETEKDFLRNFENNLAESLEKYNLENKTKEQLIVEREKTVDTVKKGFKRDKIIKVIKQEIAEFQKIIYQKSVDFRDNHIFPVNVFSELQKKIKEGAKGIFLIFFCNNLDCETKIKEKVPSYSIRCISLTEKPEERGKCIFCAAPAVNYAYLGRSY
ncbi:aminoacyl--tRNA ligase-related protein [endosymbiont GvMRE of Glomus versiforme]|uniref:aminoacyl--tRNA ligase-related protein n=1 Tax=endosymbiont GvMRE of Glomus versiforme TaxID=2039283 RepID=UPI000EBF68F1|nr:aminoacyl--tRNA ligase-related protein [endosymbiont GvMRE of Glomus versiforme]RHZ35440.1 Proline--tRNA ligase [endosymbiont GvMRE of Glomus versiforme]